MRFCSREFKYDLRKLLEPLVKEKYHVWSGNAIEWLERPQQYCTIFSCYFSLTVNVYDPYSYVFETDHEDLIIDLFSEPPTRCWFQRVSGTLIAHVWTLRKPMKKANMHPSRDAPKHKIEEITRDS